MKMSTLSSLLVLMSVASMIAIAPSAFAAHHEVTVTNAPGSSTPGCEETDSCFIPSTATVDVGAIVTWDNTDKAHWTEILRSKVPHRQKKYAWFRKLNLIIFQCDKNCFNNGNLVQFIRSEISGTARYLISLSFVKQDFHLRPYLIA